MPTILDDSLGRNTILLLSFVLIIGLMKTAVLLDRERQSWYNLEAHVQDREKSEWECVSRVEIAVLDLNDNAPLFVSNNNNTASLSEDAQIGTIVIKMHANDADIGIYKFETYFAYSLLADRRSAALVFRRIY